MYFLKLLWEFLWKEDILSLAAKFIVIRSMNVRQALTPEKQFPSPRRGWNPQPSDDRWVTPIIDLPRLRWRVNVQVGQMRYPSGSCDMLIMILIRQMLRMRELGDNLDKLCFSEVSASRTFAIVGDISNLPLSQKMSENIRALQHYRKIPWPGRPDSRPVGFLTPFILQWDGRVVLRRTRRKHEIN